MKKTCAGLVMSLGLAMLAAQTASATLAWDTPQVYTDSSFMTGTAKANFTLYPNTVSWGGETWQGCSTVGSGPLEGTQNGITIDFVNVNNPLGSWQNISSGYYPANSSDALLNQGAYNAFSPPNVLKITGLDSSKQYQIQYLRVDNRENSAIIGRSIQMKEVDGSYAYTGVNSGVIQYAYGSSSFNFVVITANISGYSTFSADPYCSKDGWNGNEISAVRIVAIPEPGSLTLLGLLGGALLLRRKLRRG